jgi:multidrug efflux pump
VGVTEASPDVSFERMTALQEEMASVVREDPDVANVSSFIGADGTNPTTNSGRLNITLKSRPGRKADAQAIISRLRAAATKVAGMSLYLQAAQDLQIDTRVSRTEYQYTLEDADPDELRAFAPQLQAALEKAPELEDVTSDLGSAGLRLVLDIDRDTASRLGVTSQAIDDTLYDAFGQRQVSTIFTQLNLYRVILEVRPADQRSVAGLDRVFVARQPAPRYRSARSRIGGMTRRRSRSATKANSHRSPFHSTRQEGDRSATPFLQSSARKPRSARCRPAYTASFKGRRRHSNNRWRASRS